jgi:hypothetical protein
LARKSTISPVSAALASSPKSNSSFQFLSSSLYLSQLGGEGPARLGAEALQRADLLVAQERSTSASSKVRPAGRLAEREAAGVLARPSFPVQV